MSEIKKLHQRFCDYSLVFKGNTPMTIKWLKEAMRLFLNATQSESINDITRHVIGYWILNGKLEKHWAAKTIRSRLQALSLFFDWCVKEGYLKKNPTQDIPRPGPHTRPACTHATAVKAASSVSLAVVIVSLKRSRDDPSSRPAPPHTPTPWSRTRIPTSTS